MFKKLRKNEKGFTLAELLIVVAIIGVLVAISIPIFTSQLEKAREATDLANVRSAYAEVQTAVLTKSTQADLTKENNDYITLTGDPDTMAYSAEVKLTQQKPGWETTDAGKAVAGITSTGSPSKNGKATITYDDSTGATAIKYE